MSNIIQAITLRSELVTLATLMNPQAHRVFNRGSVWDAIRWLFYNACIPLAPLGAAAILSFYAGLPTLEHRLSDGTLFMYAFVLIATSFGVHSSLIAQRSSVKLDLAIGLGLFFLFSFLVLYVSNQAFGPNSRGLDLPLGVGGILLAMVYGLYCNHLGGRPGPVSNWRVDGRPRHGAGLQSVGEDEGVSWMWPGPRSLDEGCYELARGMLTRRYVRPGTSTPDPAVSLCALGTRLERNMASKLAQWPWKSDRSRTGALSDSMLEVNAQLQSEGTFGAARSIERARRKMLDDADIGIIPL